MRKKRITKRGGNFTMKKIVARRNLELTKSHWCVTQERAGRPVSRIHAFKFGTNGTFKKEGTR